MCSIMLFPFGEDILFKQAKLCVFLKDQWHNGFLTESFQISSTPIELILLPRVMLEIETSGNSNQKNEHHDDKNIDD